jgi:hypothetical protein
MRYYPRICTFLVLVMLYFTGLSQDRLVKKDSSVIEGKVLEVGTTEIRFKLKSKPDGPVFVDYKSEFVRIEYENGRVDSLKNPSPPKQTVTETEPVKIRRKERGVNNIYFWDDWVKMNIDVGATISNNFGITPTGDYPYSELYTETYTKTKESNAIKMQPYGAINLMLGRKKVLKHLFGLSYHTTKTDYRYQYSNVKPPKLGASASGNIADYTVNGIYNYLDLNNGLNWRLKKGLHMCLIVSVSFPLNSRLMTNGYSAALVTQFDHYDSLNVAIYKTTGDTTYYSNAVLKDEMNGVQFSIQGKIYYDMKVKEQVFGIYIMGNFSTNMNMPYCALGLSWYPFKKIRVKEL